LLVVTGDHECGYLLGPDHKDGTDNSPVTDPIVDKGVGVVPGHSYHSPSHTNQLIPLYAKGANAAKYTKYQNIYDLVRGYYIDNTDVPHMVMESWNRLSDGNPSITGNIGTDKVDYQLEEPVLNVYPTLVDNYVTVEAAEGSSIDIVNLSGQMVYSTVAGKSTISLSLLGKGLYIVKLGNRAAKIVKQ